ncbi:MAG: GNAT family N-acetyltransferase [Chloroflexi bacterium]|nr:GNAT family N-acetyltransferase [Chloroflexota bacterium]
MVRQSRWRILRATPTHLPAITALYQADAFPHAWGDTKRIAPLFESAEVSGGFTLVAIQDGQTIGHLELSLEHGEDQLSGFITGLEVHHRIRRRGVGRGLVETAMSILARQGIQSLQVFPEDHAAAAFYTALGFTPSELCWDLTIDTTQRLPQLAAIAPRQYPMSTWQHQFDGYHHCAGQFLPAHYCWERSRQARALNFPEGEGTGAWILEGGALLIVDTHFTHLLLPPSLHPLAPEAFPAWMALIHSAQERGAAYLRTVVSPDVATALGWTHPQVCHGYESWQRLSRGIAP